MTIDERGELLTMAYQMRGMAVVMTDHGDNVQASKLREFARTIDKICTIEADGNKED